MADAFVLFEREGRDGVVAVGSYLIDVMNRLGIKTEESCLPAAGDHHCTVTILSGSDLLSPLTAAEREHFESVGRKGNVRFACDAKIVGSGEIVIMTEEKKVDPETPEPKTNIVNEFEALPLEQKIADLVRMEAVALGETISFVVNSPYLVVEKIGDVLAEFGMKLDREAKEAKHPTESEPEAESKPEQPAEPKKKRTPRAPKKADDK